MNLSIQLMQLNWKEGSPKNSMDRAHACNDHSFPNGEDKI